MSKLTIDAAGIPFEVDREMLINRSNYFKRMLSGNFAEGSMNQISFSTIPPDYIRLLLDIINQGPYTPSLAAMWLIQYFDILGEDINTVHRKVRINNFSEYLRYLDTIYPEGFDEDVIDIIASHAPYDLSMLEPEFAMAIKRSKEYRYTGYIDIDKVLSDLHDEALDYMDNPLKYYKLNLGLSSNTRCYDIIEIGPYLVSAHSPAEAFLK